jgi:AcrR family transcriptional regulator
MNQFSEKLREHADDLPKTAKGRATRERLLLASESEFGENGFQATSITAIAERAGVAAGTFYVHFSGKEEVFRALVIRMNKAVRRHISERVVDARHRLEAEREGLRAFLQFARSNKNLYRIVMEAQFVAPDLHRAHYEVFVDAYERQLGAAARRGEVRAGEDRMRGWALIGLNVFIGLRYAVWDDDTAIDDVVDAVMDLIEHGLSP